MGSLILRGVGLLLSLIFLGGILLWDQVAVLPVFLLKIKNDPFLLYGIPSVLSIFNLLSLIFPKTFNPIWREIFGKLWSKKTFKLLVGFGIYIGLYEGGLILESVSNFLCIFFGLITFFHLFSGFGFVKSIFGVPQYNKPKWLEDFSLKEIWKNRSEYINRFKLHVRAQKKVYLSLAVLSLIVGGSYFTYLNWPKKVVLNQSTKVKDIQFSFNVSSPSQTYYQKDGNGGYKKNISNLYIEFNKSVGPLDMVGKKLEKGLPRFSPEVKGEWSWQNDQSLKFTPLEDWAHGQEYRLELHELNIPKRFVTEENFKTFKTRGLSLDYNSGEFYVDPRDQKLKKAIFSLTFNYPINKVDFHKFVKITQIDYFKKSETKKNLKFTLVFDDLGQKAYVHTENIKIPEFSGKVLLELKQGLRSVEDKSSLEKSFNSTVNLPGMKDYFKLEAMNLSLVDNREGIPEHILNFSLSLGIKKEELLDNLTIEELPVSKDLPSLSVRNKMVKITNWVSNSDRISELKNEDKRIINFKAKESPEIYPKDLFLKAEVRPDYYYLVTLKKGLKSADGFKLYETYDRVFRAERYPTRLKFMHEGNILSLQGSKKINIFGLNRKGYQIEVGMLLKNQIHHLISQSSGSFTNPRFNNYQFDEDNISYKLKKKFKFSSFKTNAPLYGHFDFSDYLHKTFKGQGTEGIFFIRLLTDEDYPSELDRRLVIVSDLGVVIKKDNQGNQEFFIQSLSNGSPIADAKLEYIAVNGVPQLRGITDNRGHATLKEDAGQRDKQSRTIGVLISKGNDRIFMRKNDYNRMLNLSRFQTGGVHSRGESDSLKAYLFSDRGIYRPGEEVRIGSIVKERSFKRDLDGIPIYLTVTNSRGKRVQKLDQSLNGTGLNSFRFDTNENDPTGEYSLNLYTYRTENGRKFPQLLGSTTVKVEEFLPDRLKIQTNFNADGEKAWIDTQDLKAVVTLKNLFGFPAVGHDIRGLLKIENKSLYFGKFREFEFVNPTKRFEPYSENLSVLKTNDSGVVEFDLPLEKFSNKIFQLTFYSEGFEKEGGRSVNGARSVLVSPYKRLIGIRKPDDYSFIKKEQKKRVDFIAINNELKMQKTDQFSLEFFERKYLNVLTKRPNGSFGYESIVKDILIEKGKMAFDSKGPTNLNLKTNEPGDFRYRIVDEKGEVFSQFDYTVVGKRDLARSLTRDVELKIKLENKDINPGEILSFEVRSGYTGAGLITIETDKVESFKWFNQSDKTTVQSIKVPSNVEGNAYLNVTLLRSKNSKEIYTTPLSYGVVPFTLNKDGRKNDLELNVKGVHKPGEKVTIKFKSRRTSDIILYAVDEGILQFAKYQPPRPIDFFFKKRALEVVTYQLLDLLLPEYEQVMRSLAPGGGFGAISQQLNPFKRKKKEPVAFWSDILKAGPVANEWSFTVPDYFNGNLKIFAVSVNQQKIGVEKSESFVRADLIITPTVATFVSPGDKFKVPLTIFNNTPSDNSNNTVSLKVVPSSGLEVLNQNSLVQKKEISKETDAPFSLEMKAKEDLGNQELKFIASSGSYKNQLVETMSLRPGHPHVNFYHFDVAKPGKSKIEEDTEYFPHYFDGSLNLGLTPTSLLEPFLSLLSQNPYGCTEQLLSKAYPLLAQWDTVLDQQKKADMAVYITKTINMLYGRKMPRGRVSLYPSGRRTDDFLMLYALDFLIDAKNAGISLNEEFISSLVKGLKDSLGSMGDVYRAYGVYLLVKAEIIPGRYLADLEEAMKGILSKKKTVLSNRDKLAVLYLAAIYQSLGDKDKGNSLIKGIDFYNNTYSYYDHYYNRGVIQLKMVHLLAHHFPNTLTEAPTEFLVEFFNSNKRYFTTLGSAEAIRALVSLSKVFDKAFKGKVQVFTYERGDDGKDVKKELNLEKGINRKFELNSKTIRVEIANGSKIPLFFTFTKSGFPRSGAENISKGIEISKELQDLNGKVVSEVKLGDEVKVVLRMRAISKDYLHNLAVVDLFPGGFENVLSDEGKPQQSKSYESDFFDVREDRMISYGSVNKEVSEIIYRIKAINVGEFHIPPAKVESMYDKEIMAIGKSLKLKVVEK